MVRPKTENQREVSNKTLQARKHSRVAQLVERAAVNRLVVGSSPASGANFIPSSLEPYVQTLAQLTPTNQQLVLNLIQGLAERDGILVTHTLAPGLQILEEGKPLWIAGQRG